MDKPGRLPGGVLSQIRNAHSRRLYMVSTGPQKARKDWATAVIPVAEKRALFGLIKRPVPDVHHQIAAFIRGSKEEAYMVHAKVRDIVEKGKEEDWQKRFPPATPPDGS